MAKVFSILSMLGFSPTVAQFGHEMRAEYLTSTGSFIVPFLVLDEWHERYPGASHGIGFRRMQ
jgi:hypothetical protein